MGSIWLKLTPYGRISGTTIRFLRISGRTRLRQRDTRRMPREFPERLSGPLPYRLHSPDRYPALLEVLVRGPELWRLQNNPFLYFSNESKTLCFFFLLFLIEIHLLNVIQLWFQLKINNTFLGGCTYFILTEWNELVLIKHMMQLCIRNVTWEFNHNKSEKNNLWTQLTTFNTEVLVFTNSFIVLETQTESNIKTVFSNCTFMQRSQFTSKRTKCKDSTILVWKFAPFIRKPSRPFNPAFIIFAKYYKQNILPYTRPSPRLLS